MRLFSLFLLLLFISTAYAAICHKYTQIVHGDKEVLKLYPNLSRSLQNERDQECDNCTVSYYWSRKDGDNYGFVDCLCNVPEDKCELEPNFQSRHHDEVTVDRLDCGNGADICKKENKEETRKKWKEYFGAKVAQTTTTTKATTTTTTKATTTTRELDAENGTSDVFSTNSVLIIVVLVTLGFL